MPYYETRRTIDATPETTWQLLTDARRLSDGSFSIIRIEGDIAAGRTIKLWSEVDPKRAFALKVSRFDAPREMWWQNGLPLGLFMGTRRFTLRSAGDGTDFHMREDYTGPLKNMFFRMIPDLQPSFETFADALKSASEGLNT